MMLLLSAILFASSALAVALPEPAPAAATSFCPKVKSIITALKARQTASAFCSSYLHITATTTTLPGGVVTETSTSTSTTAVFASDLACVGGEGVEKRAPAVKSIARPACFKNYAGAVLSSACSCLSIPTPTSTVGSGPSTTTETTTTTVTATATSFKMQADYNSLYADGYAGVINFRNTFDSPDAGIFELVTNEVGTCELHDISRNAYIYVGSDHYVDDRYDGFYDNCRYSICPVYPPKCTIDLTDNSLQCSTPYGGTSFHTDQDFWSLGDGTGALDQNPFTVHVAPAV